MPLNMVFQKKFYLQISLPGVHPVQISSSSDYCITTDMLKTPKMPKKRPVSKIGVWSLLNSQNQIFPAHSAFAWC